MRWFSKNLLFYVLLIYPLESHLFASNICIPKYSTNKNTIGDADAVFKSAESNLPTRPPTDLENISPEELGRNSELRNELDSIWGAAIVEKLADPDRKEAIAIGQWVFLPPRKAAGAKENHIPVFSKEKYAAQLENFKKRFDQEVTEFLRASKDASSFWSSYSGSGIGFFRESDTGTLEDPNRTYKGQTADAITRESEQKILASLSAEARDHLGLPFSIQNNLREVVSEADKIDLNNASAGLQKIDRIRMGVMSAPLVPLVIFASPLAAGAAPFLATSGFAVGPTAAFATGLTLTNISAGAAGVTIGTGALMSGATDALNYSLHTNEFSTSDFASHAYEGLVTGGVESFPNAAKFAAVGALTGPLGTAASKLSQGFGKLAITANAGTQIVGYGQLATFSTLGGIDAYSGLQSARENFEKSASIEKSISPDGFGLGARKAISHYYFTDGIESGANAVATTLQTVLPAAKAAKGGFEYLRSTESKSAIAERAATISSSSSAIALRLSFGDPVADQLATSANFRPDTVAYRYMDKKFLQEVAPGKFMIKPNPSADATIRNIYASGKPKIEASTLEGPSLNISTSQAFYDALPLDSNQIVVSMKMADLAAAKAKPYPDEGTGIANSFVFGFKDGETNIPVQIYRRAESPLTGFVSQKRYGGVNLSGLSTKQALELTNNWAEIRKLNGELHDANGVLKNIAADSELKSKHDRYINLRNRNIELQLELNELSSAMDQRKVGDPVPEIYNRVKANSLGVDITTEPVLYRLSSTDNLARILEEGFQPNIRKRTDGGIASSREHLINGGGPMAVSMATKPGHGTMVLMMGLSDKNRGAALTEGFIYQMSNVENAIRIPEAACPFNGEIYCQNEVQVPQAPKSKIMGVSYWKARPKTTENGVPTSYEITFHRPIDFQAYLKDYEAAKLNSDGGQLFLKNAKAKILASEPISAADPNIALRPQIVVVPKGPAPDPVEFHSAK